MISHSIRRFPFDSKNPFGFLVAIAIQYVMFSRGELVGACALVLAIGSYLYSMAITKSIKACLFAIMRNVKYQNNRTHLFKQFVEFIKLHSGAQQLSNGINRKDSICDSKNCAL